MTRPLLISDCDEVLLHMVRHFADWLGEAHEVDFTIGTWERSIIAVATCTCGGQRSIAPSEVDDQS